MKVFRLKNVMVFRRKMKMYMFILKHTNTKCALPLQYAKLWDADNEALGDPFNWNAQCGALTEVQIGRVGVKRGRYFLDAIEMPPAALSPGDEIKIGGHHAEVYVVDAVETVKFTAYHTRLGCKDDQPRRIRLTAPYVKARYVMNPSYDRWSSPPAKIVQTLM